MLDNNLVGFKRVFHLGDEMMRIAGMTAYIAVGARNETQCVWPAFGQWLNESEVLKLGLMAGSKMSRAPMIAFHKMAEALTYGRLEEVSLTPLFPKNNGGCGFKGGAALRNYGVGVSKLHEKHDQMLAVLFLSVLFDESIRLHHYGLRHVSEPDYREAVKLRAGPSLGQWERNTKNILRTYSLIFFDSGGNPIFFEDHFSSFDSSPTLGGHWDVVASNPALLLQSIADSSGELVNSFGGEPVGVVWVQGDEKNMPLGIMARHDKDVYDPRES